MAYSGINHRGGRPNKGLTTLQELAWVKVFYAVKTGKLVRPNFCSVCGAKGKRKKNGNITIEAHHKDYAKPLDVVWLCDSCHRDTFNRARGERHGNSKLTDAKVIEIKRLIERGYSSVALAMKYNVYESTIARIKSGQTWRHIS